MLNNFYSQVQDYKIMIKIIIDAQVWISYGIFKAWIAKDVDKAGESIKERGNRKSKKKSKLNSLNIEKSSNKMVLTTEEELTVRLINKLLSIKIEKSILLYSKIKDLVIDKLC